MTKEQFKQIRTWYGLNKTQFAKLLKVSQPMVVKWESERDIPPYIERQLEFFQGLSHTKQQKYIQESKKS